MIKHIPNTLTCLNLVTGAIGCISILNGNYDSAIYYVLIAGLFDFFDGFAARWLKVQSAIGKELDSLADVISFGLLPAFYLFVRIEEVAAEPRLAYVGLVVAAFSALRLAKFNIDESQSDRFIGVPTPANAILITSLSFLPGTVTLNEIALICISIVTSLLLVSNLPMIALKFKGAAWKPNQLKYSFLILIGLLIAVFQLAALPFIIPAYIFISLIGNFMGSQSV